MPHALSIAMKDTLKIGLLSLSSWAISAPLAGISSLPWRVLLHEMGASLTFSEMISSEGLIRNCAKTRLYFENVDQARPFAAQIFGANPKNLALAARILDDEPLVDLIDINMGCPVKKVVSRGAGAALMKDPILVSRIVQEVRGATSKPLTVKIRSGWDENNINYIEIGRIAESHGADAVILHPRTRSSFLKGKSEWSQIGELKSKLSIPVIGNGDIKTADDAISMRSETLCDGVMIGRAAIGNPWIFNQIKNESLSSPDQQERMRVILRLLSLMKGHRSERYSLTNMRTVIPWHVKGMKGAKDLLREVNITKNTGDLINLLSEFFTLPTTC